MRLAMLLSQLQFAALVLSPSDKHLCFWGLFMILVGPSADSHISAAFGEVLPGACRSCFMQLDP